MRGDWFGVSGGTLCTRSAQQFSNKCGNETNELFSAQTLYCSIKVFNKETPCKKPELNINRNKRKIHIKMSTTTLYFGRSHPRRALQDFSVSLLLDQSHDNIKAYLHRGVVYNEIGRWSKVLSFLSRESCFV